MRDVKRKKWLVLFSIIAFFSPLSAFGEETEDQIGIGFQEEQPVDPKDPVDPKEPVDPSPMPYYEEPRWVPFNNVLPYTLGSARNYYARESRNSLPKTGELRQTGMQWLGFFCVACSFWLFLFTRLKEEADEQEIL